MIKVKNLKRQRAAVGRMAIGEKEEDMTPPAAK